jgi:TolB protein
LLDPSTGETKTLTQANVLAFFWSPDGQQIAYLTLPQQPDRGIQAVSFSPIGQSENVGVFQREELRFELWSVDVQTAEKTRLATFLPSGLFLSQFLPFFDQYALSHRLWSPKGDAIVFPMVQDGISHLSIVQVDSGEIDVLTDGEIGFWSHQ